MAKVLGIPWNQPYRSVKGMMDYLGGVTDDLRRLIYSEYTIDEKKVKKPTTASTYLKKYKKQYTAPTSSYLNKYKNIPGYYFKNLSEGLKNENRI